MLEYLADLFQEFWQGRSSRRDCRCNYQTELDSSEPCQNLMAPPGVINHEARGRMPGGACHDSTVV